MDEYTGSQQALEDYWGKDFTWVRGGVYDERQQLIVDIAEALSQYVNDDKDGHLYPHLLPHAQRIADEWIGRGV